jgi:hypothetical protein
MIAIWWGGAMANDLGDELARLLEPGEKVLWSGRPHYPYLRSEAWAAFVFGLMALAAASMALLILVALLGGLIVEGDGKLLPGLLFVGVPAAFFGHIASQAMKTPWSAPRSLARAFYAVTDRRVIVRGAVGYAPSAMLPTPHHDLYFFSPRQALGRKVRKHRGKRVDLVLEVETHRGGRSNTRVEIGILGAEDWRGAEAAIDAAFGRDAFRP